MQKKKGLKIFNKHEPKNIKDADIVVYSSAIKKSNVEILEARKMLCSQVRPEEMDELFRWMYDNLQLWGDTQEQQDSAILIIAKGLRNIPMVADQEINLSATLVELCQIKS